MAWATSSSRRPAALARSVQAGRRPARRPDAGEAPRASPREGRTRKGFEPDPGAPRYLVTVRGLGYKFEP
ncbi:hypothetical protein DEJ51_14935 [Streptomyces venezuelae]|uniref:OmpR/PhoB-type domain-containing protein n=1 Tax=Streptomyces venezuelae TaxID=54571 RepID=A0A5P2DJH9_STRVZ|nr:hypothetical protein DEJ51_14935 [Streptomyces venezuelae]